MVREYTKNDYAEVSSWFHARNIKITEDYLPEHGFIVQNKAAGFIYSTDSNWCIFECFIGNPDAARTDRQEALRAIVPEMIKKAKNMGFKQAFGFAVSQTMLKIGMENEFKFVETCSTIVREL